MREFFIGLVFVLAAALFVGLGILLFPLLLALTIVLRIILIAILLFLSIWLLGKFVIFIWESLRK